MHEAVAAEWKQQLASPSAGWQQNHFLLYSFPSRERKINCFQINGTGRSSACSDEILLLYIFIPRYTFESFRAQIGIIDVRRER